MPNVQPPHLQSLASGLPADVSAQLFAAFGAADKYARDIAQALNPALVVGDTLQVFRPYTQAAPLAVGSGTALVFAHYNTTAAQSCAPGFNLINFDTAVVSSSAVTTGAAWKFTAPRAGDFEVSGLVTFTNAIAANTLVASAIFQNGANSGITSQRNTGNAANFNSVGGSTIMRLAAGDYIDFEAYNGDAVNRALTATATDNWIKIRELTSDTPRVPSCFPFDVPWPKSYLPTMVLAQVADVNQTNPAALALQLPDWGTSTKGGQTMIKVRNIPGLLPSTSYSVTLVVF